MADLNAQPADPGQLDLRALVEHVLRIRPACFDKPLNYGAAAQ
jgi:hypothetical protein